MRDIQPLKCREKKHASLSYPRCADDKQVSVAIRRAFGACEQTIVAFSRAQKGGILLEHCDGVNRTEMNRCVVHSTLDIVVADIIKDGEIFAFGVSRCGEIRNQLCTTERIGRENNM